RVHATDPPSLRRPGMAGLSALPRNAVSPAAPPTRSAWVELREAPGPFVRGRPHLVLIPLVFVLFLAAWEGVVRLWGIPAFLVPSPSTVGGALVRGVRSGLYLAHLWVTLYEALLGFGIAAAAGIILGALIAQFRVVEQTFYPYLVALQTLPKIA